MATPGAMNGILYIHNAILADTQAFEERALDLDPRDEAAAASLLKDVMFFMDMAKKHEAGEEDFFFPPAEDRFRYVSGPYRLEHKLHEGLVEQLLTAIPEVQVATPSNIAASQRKVYRAAVALNSVMQVHVAKENELLVPFFEQEFTDDEIREIDGRLNATLTPDVMQALLPWMFQRQSLEYKAGMVRELMGMLPMEMLPPVVQLISSAVTTEEWGQVENRVPELRTILE